MSLKDKQSQREGNYGNCDNIKRKLNVGRFYNLPFNL